jgi:cob(I)alamin adenosyltransferase
MTNLGNGQQVEKSHPRLAAYGDVDELNTTLGLIAAEPLPEGLGAVLNRVQQDLLDLGGELVVPGESRLDSERVEALEHHVDDIYGHLAPLQDPSLPGGCRPGALAHFARSVCRRAERSVFALSAHERVSGTTLRYLNRLSDLLLVIARRINQAAESRG